MKELWDRKAALKRLLDNDALLNAVCAMFIDAAPARLEKLREAIECKDTELTRQLAHSLKGLCGEVCANSLRALFLTIENKAKEGTLDCDDELEKASQLLPKLISAMKNA